jgi:hypothetical protein
METSVSKRSLTMKSPAEAFRAAARKVERAIAHLAAGGSVAAGDMSAHFHEDARKVSDAINRLDDRTNKPEIRGDDAVREEAWAVVSDLRKRKIAADAAGFEAAQAARTAEIDRIRCCPPLALTVLDTLSGKARS